MIGIALLAALIYTINRDGGGQKAGRLDGARVDLLASDLMQHAISAEMAVKQMTAFGVDYDQLLDDKPADVGYSTTPNLQIYHPSGGGVDVFATQDSNLFDANSGQTRGWQWQNTKNVEWTPTTAIDLVYSFIDLNPDICAELNKRLLGNTTIPTSTVDFDDTFINNTTNTDFVVAECADCEDMKAMCISDGSTYAFYNIIGAR